MLRSNTPLLFMMIQEYINTRRRSSALRENKMDSSGAMPTAHRAVQSVKQWHTQFRKDIRKSHDPRITVTISKF